MAFGWLQEASEAAVPAHILQKREVLRCGWLSRLFLSRPDPTGLYTIRDRDRGAGVVRNYAVVMWTRFTVSSEIPGPIRVLCIP